MKNFRYTQRVYGLLQGVGEKVLLPLIPKGPMREKILQSLEYRSLEEVRPPLTTEETAELIKNYILEGQPRLVSRFGSTELRALMKWKNRRTRSGVGRLYAMFTALEAPIWTSWEHRNLFSQSGVFPLKRWAIEEFYHETAQTLGDIDLLGSWVEGENVFAQELKDCEITSLKSLEPFWTSAPWTRALAGKKVLVVHPFVASIENQFRNRRVAVWGSRSLLPEFELKLLEPVQSLAGEPSVYGSWRKALEGMKKEMSQIDFDVAIIAAGAYGLPLGAFAKRLGKIAIHLGGVTQILFGIKGKRWDSEVEYSSMYNSHWVRPLPKERPKHFRRVDGGVYW